MLRKILSRNCGLSSLFNAQLSLLHKDKITTQFAQLIDCTTSVMNPAGQNETISDELIESPWVTGKFLRDSIIWPNPALEDARCKPMHRDVRDRMVNLWSTSCSHGVSWDELDEAFLAFHREYIEREKEWTENYNDLWETEYKKSEDFLRKSLSGQDDSTINTILHRRRGKIRRMTHTRISRLRFKQILKPAHLRQFTEYMRGFVTERMIKREIVERKI